MTSRPRQRADLRWLVIASGGFALALILSLTGFATQLLDAGIYLDLHVIALLNKFAHKSQTIDTLIWWIWTNSVFQGGIVVGAVWGAWFSRSDELVSRPRRE